MGFVVDLKGNLKRYTDRFSIKKNLIIPSKVKRIKDKVFCANKNIETIDISNNVTTIGVRAFFNCENLNKVVIGSSVETINNECFAHCHNLNNIEFSDGLISIGTRAFAHCRNIKNITLPSTIQTLDKETFYNCDKMTSIDLPQNLISIGDGCFLNCDKLNNIIIPQSISIINEETFKDCKSLQNIKWSNVKIIGSKAFENCAFRSLNIPDSVTSIGSQAFARVSTLKKFVIPNSVTNIHYEMFSDCPNISQFKIGDKEFYPVNLIDLEGMSDVEILYMPLEKCDESLFYKIDFTSKNTIDPIGNSLIISTLFSQKELLQRKEIACILPFVAGKCINSNNYKLIKKELLNNYKEFSRFLKNTAGKENLYRTYSNRLVAYDLYKLAHVMGAFEDDQRIRQRACEFLALLFQTRQLYLFNVHSLLNNLNFKNYDSEIAEFLTNKDNWNEILTAELDNNKRGYLASIINEFDNIKEYARSNRGSQGYKKITLKIADIYFSSKEFDGVNRGNEDISLALFPYTHNQETFNQAERIKKTYAKLKSLKIVDNHILHEELFSEISSIKKQIIDNSQTITDDLSQIANQYFTYEYLSKADPKNFVLGKYCSCCAHLEGAGKGIVKASILHPDCQNLVVKDKKGRIVAKSTLYINKKQGYGVFNNIEVNDQIDESKRKYIYYSYKKAVSDFAVRYNELNPKNPIYQINVGMHLNDLESNIRFNDKKSENILEGLDFSKYGNYKGDWWDEQYVIWKDDTLISTKQNKKRS